MEKLNIVILSVDDWAGMYVNGKIFNQGHTIKLNDVLSEFVGKNIYIETFETHYIKLDDDNEDLIRYGNQFPDTLNEVIEYSQIKR